MPGKDEEERIMDTQTQRVHTGIYAEQYTGDTGNTQYPRQADSSVWKMA